MKANFIVRFVNGSSILPPFIDSTGGIQLRYIGDGGVAAGGYVCLSFVPAKTVIVQVDVSAATITDMKADADYVWLEDISGGRRADDMLVSDKRKTDLRTWLTDEGYNSSRVNKLELRTEEDLVKQTAEFHHITREQYNAGGLG